MAGLGQQLLGLRHIVDRLRRLPVEFEISRDKGVAGQPAVAEGHRVIDALAVDREIDGAPRPLVMPRRFRIPLLGEIDPPRGLHDRRLERQPRRLLEIRRELAADPIGDVDLAVL